MSLRLSRLSNWCAPPTPRCGFHAAVLATCAFAITLSMRLALERFQGPPLIWPVNAAILAALLSGPRRARCGLLVAGLLGYALASAMIDKAIWNAACSAGVHLLEILTCLALLDRWCGAAFDLLNWRHLKSFGLAAGVVAPLLAASAATGLHLGTGGQLYMGFASHWAAEALGLLIVTPPCLGVLRLFKEGLPLRISVRAVAALAGLSAVTMFAFGQSRYPMLFLVPPALLLVTLELETLTLNIGLLWIAGIVTIFTVLGSGPQQLLNGSIAERILTLQLFLLVCAHATLAVTVLQRRRRELEDDLREARETAESATRAKAEFLANMSHELRTPLTSVLGFARIVEDQPDLSPTSQKHVRQVLEAGSALQCMVNDILDFSKLEAGELTIRTQPTAPFEIAKATLELLEPRAGAKALKLGLDCRFERDLTVEVDPDRLRQILLHLVGNAVKFTEVGGVDVVLAHDDGQLRIEVADTGPGVPTQQIPLLFRRFYQVDGSRTRAHGGTGLGLAICKGVVEAMGGEIGVDTSAGRGSRFWVSIPAPVVSSPGPAEESPRPTEAQAPENGGPRVLVADDHPANRELTRLLLSAVGAEVHEAADGQEALEIAEGCAFDVILMDISMPRLDGMAAAAAIHNGQGPNAATPILAFTAGVDELSLARLSRADFFGLVPKPIDPNGLIEAVLNASGERLAVAEPTGCGETVLHG